MKHETQRSGCWTVPERVHAESHVQRGVLLQRHEADYRVTELVSVTDYWDRIKTLSYTHLKTAHNRPDPLQLSERVKLESLWFMFGLLRSTSVVKKNIWTRVRVNRV